MGVSKDKQDSGNQLGELRSEAARRGLDVTAEYVLGGAPAWKGEHRELAGTPAGTLRSLAGCRAISSAQNAGHD